MITVINSKKLTVTPQWIIRLLVIVFWTQNTIISFILEVFEKLPIVGQFSDFVLPVLYVVLIVMSVPYNCRRIHLADLIFYLSIVLIVIATMFLHVESLEYITPELWRILGLSVPVYFIGILYDHEQSQKDLFWCSLLSVIVVFVYQIYVLSTGRMLANDNMDASYNILPSIMYLIYWAFTNSNARNWVFAAGGIALSFIFGTRGPILAIFIFFALCLAGKIIKMKNIALKILLLLLIIGITIYMVTGNRILDWAKALSQIFEDIGFSTRIFDFIIEEQLTYDSGRGALSDAVLVAISQRPILGYGFMGDRAVLGFYVHNILLELLCSYGIVLGSIVILLLIGIPIVAIRRSHGTLNSILLLMFLCMVFTKLMFSGSYVYEPYFYLLIGLSVGMLRRYRKPSMGLETR